MVRPAVRKGRFMSQVKAFITGVSSLVLNDDEKAFIREHQPWAFILFARNIGTADEVRALTASLRESVGRNAFIFIDQEGGRVQRLRPPLAPNYPPAATLGALYKANAEKGLRAAWILSRLHAFDLIRLGINADCLPLLDVPVEGAHDVIGARAYGYEPQTVTLMGRRAAEGLVSGGVLPVMKHIPGHGRACADTHFELARVDSSLKTLKETDFVPFKALNDLPVAMTAHVVYEAVDKTRPATLSPTVIQDVVRDYIGFDGLLMSDDLSMKALSGDFAQLTRQTFAAGCDLVLHCNGNMEEMLPVAENSPVLSGQALERAQRAEIYPNTPDDADEAALRREFEGLLAIA